MSTRDNRDDGWVAVAGIVIGIIAAWLAVH